MLFLPWMIYKCQEFIIVVITFITFFFAIHYSRDLGINTHNEKQKKYIYMALSFFKWSYFLEQFKVHNKNERKVQRLPHTPCPYSCVPPHYQCPPSESYSHYNWRTCITQNYQPKSLLYIWVHSMLCILWVWRNVQSWHVFILRLSFCPKNPLCSPIHSSLPLNPRQPLILSPTPQF